MNRSFSTETIQQLVAQLPVPQRLEIQSVLRTLYSIDISGAACLDVGFGSPVASRILRMNGGYWTSVVRSETDFALAAPFLDEEVVLPGPQGELPFEDKQFDVVVIGHGCLTGNHEADSAALEECHRILKVGGTIIMTVEYHKPWGVAYLLNRRRLVQGCGGSYSERAVFALMKSGYDVLGLRYFCRFWRQLVRQWLDRRQRRYGERDPRLSLANIFYPMAAVLDWPLYFTRGYLLTVRGRRKGWRPRGEMRMGDGRNISECVLHGYRL